MVERGYTAAFATVDVKAVLRAVRTSGVVAVEESGRAVDGGRRDLDMVDMGEL